VNSDASFHASTATGASGAAFRDADGRLLAAAAKRYSHLADALTGEFLAARDGIALAAQRGFDRVVMESDNLVLVNMLQSGIGDGSVFYGLWEEIKSLAGLLLL
jgi:hypothetical protein